jgi:hypothetical protein
LGCRNQEHLWRTNRFPAPRRMLADPELVKLKAVKVRRQFKVALKL